VEKILQITPEGLARRNKGSSTTSVFTVEKIPLTILESFARESQSRPTKSEQARGLAMIHPVKAIRSLTEKTQKEKQSLQKRSNRQFLSSIARDVNSPIGSFPVRFKSV